MSTKSDLRTSDTKERILKEAERLYHEGGYNHMALDKISKTLNVTRPALYHHFPGGKEQLFRDMIDQIIGERISELQIAISKGNTTKERLENIVRTIVSNPMMDIKRMLSTEMSEFHKDTKGLLWQKLAELRAIITGVMQEAVEKGEFREINMNLTFFSFLTLCGMCEHLTTSQSQFPEMREFIKEDSETILTMMVDHWLNGVTVRSN